MAGKMKQQRLTWFSWKKLILIVILILVICLSIYIYSVYSHLQSSKTDGYTETENTILSETDMTTIDEMYAYQDELLYHIAYARDKDDKEWIVFVPKSELDDEESEKDVEQNEKNDEDDKKENKTKEIITIEASKTIAPENIESVWAKECDQCVLKSSKPAIMDDVPLWELTYIDKQNRFVIEYRKLKDAEPYEQLKMRLKYNKKG